MQYILSLEQEDWANHQDITLLVVIWSKLE